MLTKPATNQGAISSVLGTVSTVANTVTGLFSAVGAGASMLNTYAEEASKDQSDRARIHRKVYRSNLVTNAALQQSQLELEVLTYLQANPTINEGFTKTHSDLSELFAEA